MWLYVELGTHIPQRLNNEEARGVAKVMPSWRWVPVIDGAFARLLLTLSMLDWREDFWILF